MERTVPSTASEEIELYQRTYYSLLRSTAEVQIRTLEEAHARMKSLLHPNARETAPDMTAFVYCLLRLPSCMSQVDLVVLGQSSGVFSQRGFGDVETWVEVSAPARRRRCFFNGLDTLACFIASRSDIDDVIPMLTAYQIEWNKMHSLLQLIPEPTLKLTSLDRGSRSTLSEALKIHPEDLDQLHTIWGDQFPARLKEIASKPCQLRVQLLSGSLSEYWRATQLWWERVQSAFPMLRERPVYFVSSNPHSIINLLSSYATLHQEELIDYLERQQKQDLLLEWQKIQSEQVPSSKENFFYYALKKYQGGQDDLELVDSISAHEKQCGIIRVQSEHVFDVEAQVVELSSLRPEWFDARLGRDFAYLSQSDALILNIDYPLGLAAYNILAKVAEHVSQVLGVYVTGKAATLNGVIGDVMIPNVVHDEQSRNTYLFPNAFTAFDVAPFVMHGTAMDNQKAVSVRGTFLQNTNYMDVFYREGYTDIEMEAGPYLSAVYEMYRPQRHPVNEVVNLHGVPFEVGILHYASDTPLSKGRNLGAGSLSYFGMDATYGVSLAILRRILMVEKERLQNRRSPRG